LYLNRNGLNSRRKQKNKTEKRKQENRIENKTEKRKELKTISSNV
jgi:hypothetical protein